MHVMAGMAAAISLFGAAGPQDVPDPDAAATVDDVVVSGRRLKDEARAFVDEIKAAPPYRGLARWRDPLCIATANARPAIAQPLIDHIARVGASHGLRVREPGCNPNVVIIFTDEAPVLARALVSADPEAFHVRWTRQLDRGVKALTYFQDVDAPVRWWHVSIPVLLNGRRAIPFPGDIGGPRVPGEGRVNRGRPILDAFNKVIIIVDVSRTEDVMLPQLADYLSFVALAQVDPESDMRRYDSVLNVFDQPGSVQGLSSWDRAYLASLYDAYPERIDADDQATALTGRIRREQRREAAERSD